MSRPVEKRDSYRNDLNAVGRVRDALGLDENQSEVKKAYDLASDLYVELMQIEVNRKKKQNVRTKKAS